MKRYALIVYNRKCYDAFDGNYSDDIYLSGEFDSSEYCALFKETNHFPSLMRMWNKYLDKFEGYIYCVRDRGSKFDNLNPEWNAMVGGIYDPMDFEILRENHNPTW